MKFGDKNFKEEFIKWLKIKSQDEIEKINREKERMEKAFE